MSRRRIVLAIKEAMEKEGIVCDEKSKAAVHAAIDSTVNYVLSFAQEVSQELVVAGLHSEAMVAGVFVRKMKTILNDEPTDLEK